MRSGCALVAQTVQHHFVRLQAEAIGRQMLQVARTSVNLEYAAALTAAEVMMVRRTGTLVSRWFAGKLHRNEPPAFHEGVDGAIHRGDAQLRNMAPPELQHLRGTERAGDFLENLANGIALTGVAFHTVKYDMVPPRVASVAAFARSGLICRMADDRLHPDSAPRAAWTRWLLVSAVAIAAAHLLDETAWRLVRLPSVYEKDWGRLLRIMGFLPTWLLLALAYWLQVPDRAVRQAGTWLLVLSPTLGGLSAEVLKLLVRRLRPDAEQFGYAFRSFAEGPWSNRGMGLPSSHALVAFAGAFALARLFPRARWVFYTLAAGCGLSRVMATAHFLSDTVVAACVAWGVVAIVAARLTRADS